MIRKIIKIDQEKCNGCGLCAKACHESAIAMVNDKAQLIRDDYCDGLGDCLPACPMDAISFEEREAAPYDEAAVKANIAQKAALLKQWPIQLRLVSPEMECFHKARLLIAADCTAYAYEDFHSEFLQDRVTLIGCPKLDTTDYSAKLTEIFRLNDIQSITVTRMEVPCCRGMETAVEQALLSCGKNIPLQVCTIGIKGELIHTRTTL